MPIHTAAGQLGLGARARGVGDGLRAADRRQINPFHIVDEEVAPVSDPAFVRHPFPRAVVREVPARDCGPVVDWISAMGVCYRILAGIDH
jgi:hypothetical protein